MLFPYSFYKYAKVYLAIRYIHSSHVSVWKIMTYVLHFNIWFLNISSQYIKYEHICTIFPPTPQNKFYSLVVHYPSLDHTLGLHLLNRRITSALFFFHSPKRSWLSLIHFMLSRVAFLGSLLKMICGKHPRYSPQGGPKMVLGRTPRPYHPRGLWLLCSFIHCFVGSVLQGIFLHSVYEKSMYMHDVSRAQQAELAFVMLKANICHCRYLYQNHVDHHWQDGEQVLRHMSCHGLLVISLSSHDIWILH